MSYARKGRNLGAAADAEIAELTEANVGLGYELAAADSTIAQQNQTLLEKNAEIETLSDTIRQWEAYSAGQDAAHAAAIAAKDVEIANLKADLAACEGTTEPPLPVEPPSVFGSSAGKHNYDYFTKMAGSPMKVRRTYDTWPAVHPREDVGRNATVWSFKMPFTAFLAGNLDDEVTAALKTIPDDGFGRYLIVNHEPEDNIKAGDFTFAQYRDVQKRVRPLVDKVNATRKTPIRFGGNWMAWTFQDSSRNPENYWPGDGVWDFLALDGYSGKNNQNQWVGGRTPSAIFGKALAFCKAKGVRFAVAETGIDVAAPEPDRVAWIKACRQYAKDANCEFWCYWDGSFSTFWLNTEAEFKAVVLGS